MKITKLDPPTAFVPVQIILETPEEIALFIQIGNRNRTVALALDDSNRNQNHLRDEATSGKGMLGKNEKNANLLAQLVTLYHY